MWIHNAHTRLAVCKLSFVENGCNIPRRSHGGQAGSKRTLFGGGLNVGRPRFQEDKHGTQSAAVFPNVVCMMSAVVL